MRRPLALLVLPLALAGCPSKDDPCAPVSQKSSVQTLMRSWYLYQDALAQVDPANPAYPGVQEYLDALTKPARDLQEDRGWTYATTSAQTQAFFQEGTSVGFGLQLLERDGPGGKQELVAQVFAGSAAADAGFARGDELLAIGDTPQTLVDVPTLLATSAFGTALGPSTAGVTRTFQVRTVAGATELRTMTKRTYGLDPVPAWTVIARDGLQPAGYVALRTFIAPAEPLLQEAFLAFRQQNVQDVVVDLRYNGGGLLTTATVLSNLLGGGLSGDVMFDVAYNALQSRNDQQVTFAPLAQAIAPARIAFVTTGASASASELVPNVFEAWKHAGVALVGARTYGKPVGQLGFELRECGTVVYLVGFRLLNAEGDGGYFQGLPDAAGAFSGPLCAAADDLTRATSDPAEASTAAALAWLATGSCPSPPAAPAAPGLSAALKGAGAPDAYPEPASPDVAQRHVRGLF
jgi:C-terminal processing protease CtpA/Prc